MNPTAAPWLRFVMAFLVFGGAGFLLLGLGGALGLANPAAAKHWLTVVTGPAALSFTVLCFAALAFLGVPQVVLIAAAAAAYGPWLGAAYSWIGTMVSALIGFGVGRAWGARFLPTAGEGVVARFMTLVARNGFIASLVIRQVPLAPFVVINIAGGASSITTADFVAGTAIGIVPKIALIALAGGSLKTLLSGALGWSLLGLLALSGLVWVGAGVAARRWLNS